MTVLGIDIGGSGIKGALVDLDTGELTTERVRIPTPQPATPPAVIETVRQLVRHFDYSGPLGVGIPSVVIDGLVLSAANIDDGWIQFPGQQAIAEATGLPVVLMNDADVAGVAEMAYGAGRNQPGVAMIFTLGTGIGSAMFVNGRIVPNMELGHIYMRKKKYDAEHYVSDRARKRDGLSWKVWGTQLGEYLQYMEALFSPNLIILGGGVSKKADKFMKYVRTRARVVPAELRNEAGIVGAALAATQRD